MEGKADAAVTETYRLLASGEGFRAGVATEVPADMPADMPAEASIEVVVRLFRTGKRLERAEMDRAMALVRELMDRGYSVYFQDDGWIACERPVGDTDAEAEARRIQGLLGGR